jgi:hypothetical protein
MSRQPLLISHPRELVRLFWKGIINAPDGKRWDISFCPGIEGSWNGFKSCWDFVWKSIKWGLGPSGHFKIIEVMWDISKGLWKVSGKLIGGIPNGIGEGFNNISSLVHDMPFGWIARIIFNLICNCFLWPVIKFGFGFFGMVASPVIFIGGSAIGCLGKLFIGSLGVVSGTVSSFVALVGGSVFSVCVALAGIFNRFPKESDNGTYGLNIIDS